MPSYTHVTHPFDPLYDANSKILILGSFPSVQSRKNCFYYSHPQNRFWRLLAKLYQAPLPASIEEKKAFCLSKNIALFDAVFSCDIISSSDSSMKNVVPSDLSRVISSSRISRVFCNGKTSAFYYNKFQKPVLKIPCTVLPSTSPANAAWTFPRLLEEWKKILQEDL